MTTAKRWNGTAWEYVVGAPGPKGDTGATGTPGTPGAAATVGVGSTTTGAAGTSAAVSNTGTSSAAVLAFTIPQGAKGDKGDTGATGAPGTTGAAGSNGWSPVFAVVSDGERRVLYLSDWVGGTGTKPTTIGYVSSTGIVATVAGGVDIRGAQGAAGTGGGGSADAKEATVDFGTVPTSARSFVVTDAAISTSSQLIVTQSGRGATGRSDDENEMDPLLLRAVPGAGQMTVYASALDGPVTGAYLLNYMVG